MCGAVWITATITLRAHCVRRESCIALHISGPDVGTFLLRWVSVFNNETFSNVGAQNRVGFVRRGQRQRNFAGCVLLWRLFGGIFSFCTGANARACVVFKERRERR